MLATKQMGKFQQTWQSGKWEKLRTLSFYAFVQCCQLTATTQQRATELNSFKLYNSLVHLSCDCI